MQEVRLNQELDYSELAFNPLEGTAYETILKSFTKTK
jgi:hypothetical protein